MKKNKLDTDKICFFIFIAAILTILLTVFSNGISGNDFWWHIKVGEYVINNSSVPSKDIFSWIGISEGINWTPHEWLSDVIFFIIFENSGQAGIFILSICSALIMIFLLIWEVRKEIKKNWLVSGLFFSLFVVITSLFYYGRPHIFSFFLIYFELKMLYKFFDDNSYKGIYLLPVLSVMWSNLHGGSSNMSYILCMVFLIVGLFNITFGKIESKRMSTKGIIILLIVTIGTMAGIFINPVGKQVFFYPYNTIGDKVSMSFIQEWHSPDAKEIGHLILFFLPIFIMSIGLISSEKKIRLIDVVVMCIFLLLFFRSVRFIILWYIAADFYAFRYVPESKMKDITGTIEKACTVLFSVILLVLTLFGVKDIYDTARSGQMIPTSLSDEAIQFIKNEQPEHLFNDYNVGDALLYNDIKVFFDARADLYSAKHIMENGISLMNLQQVNSSAEEKFVDVEKIIKQYKIDGIVILKSRPLYSYLISHTDKYDLKYEDDTIGYFKVY